MNGGAFDSNALISHRFPIERANDAYELLVSDEWSLGIILEYGSVKGAIASAKAEQIELLASQTTAEHESRVRVGVIGAGNYAKRMLIPAFSKAKTELITIASPGGLSAGVAGKKFGFRLATSDVAAVIDHSDIDVVVVASRHDTHADLVRRALAAGKSVFVEKPLAMTLEQLEMLKEATSVPNCPLLAVGFNRRFSPFAQQVVRRLRAQDEAKNVLITVNAGAIPKDHWTQDRMIGGGRIIGEACHFIDLARYLVGSPIRRVFAVSVTSESEEVATDKASIALKFDDGSIASIQYLANGAASFPKERIEVFCGGKVLQINNFRSLKTYGYPGRRRLYSWRQDKGHQQCVDAFIGAVSGGGQVPIPLQELLEVSRITVIADQLILNGGGVADV
jgi:predicted dehydrogenase